MLACVQGLARTNIGDHKNARDKTLDALPAATWPSGFYRDPSQEKEVRTHWVFHMF
jgi:hypothetical protein